MKRFEIDRESKQALLVTALALFVVFASMAALYLLFGIHHLVGSHTVTVKDLQAICKALTKCKWPK